MDTLIFMVGMAAGAMLVGLATYFSATDNQVLHKVGIERIEKCHNVHSKNAIRKAQEIIAKAQGARDGE